MKNSYKKNETVKKLDIFINVVILGFWSVICSLPIITIGTSISAAYYVTLKMVRDEEQHITQAFFKSFRSNFKKATILWLPIMAVIGGAYQLLSWLVTAQIKYRGTLLCVIAVVIVILTMLGEYLFPLTARFENTIGHTIKNSVFISILNFQQSFLMMLVNAVPVLVFLFIPKLFIFIGLFSISGVAYINSRMLRKIFDQMVEDYGDHSVETQVQEENREDMPLIPDTDEIITGKEEKIE